MSLDGHMSVKIFDFMVILYKSLISCAFSLAFHMIITLTLQEWSFKSSKTREPSTTIWFDQVLILLSTVLKGFHRLIWVLSTISPFKAFGF